MEEWRSIKDYEGLYEVSSFGSVRSLPHMTMGRWGKQKTSSGRILKLAKNGNTDYLRASLSKNGKSKNFIVHRLVAKAFINEVDNKNCVNHIDGNKTNNTVTNLEWVNHKENTENARQRGALWWRSGDNHPNVMKTHCKKGHPYSGDNLYERKISGKVYRECKQCMSESTKKWNKNNPEKRKALNASRYTKLATLIEGDKK